MWRLITILASVLAAANASGQGKVAFGNDTSHLFYLNGNLLPAPGDGWLKVALYAGRASTNLTLQSIVFLSGPTVTSPGQMARHNVILQGVPGGAAAYFKIIIVDTAAPLDSPIDGDAGWYPTFYLADDFGTSGLFTAIPGSSLTYPSLVSGGASQSTWTGPIYVGGCLECFPPDFVVSPSNAVVHAGNNVTLNALAAHLLEPVSYQWRKQFVPVVGATNSQLTLTNVTWADAGSYDVVASNSYGSTVSLVAYVGVVVPALLGAPTYNASNQFQFTVAGAPGTNYIVQVSTNLATTDWVTLFTNASPFTFTDSNTLSPHRFYRAYSH